MENQNNENYRQSDNHSILHPDAQRDLERRREYENNEKESEFNPPSQPAEEHLITEADDLQSDDPDEDASYYEDTDQGPEEIDPVNHPRDFHDIPEEQPKRPLTD